MHKHSFTKITLAAGIVAATFAMATPAEAATRVPTVRQAPSTNPVSIAPLPSPYPNPEWRGVAYPDPDWRGVAYPDPTWRPVGFISIAPLPSP